MKAKYHKKRATINSFLDSLTCRELRLTRSLALFPVGLVTKTGISSPIGAV